jgi:phosphatidate cytidylyltransferase
MSNLSLRIIFGFLYVGVIIISLYAGTPYFELLMGVFTFFSLREMALMAEKKSIKHLWIIPILLCLSIIYLAIFGSKPLNLNSLIVLWVIQLLSLLFGYNDLNKDKKINYVALSVYLYLPLLVLVVWFTQSQSYKVEYLLLYFTTIWVYDSMAYVVGKRLGKRPIFPKVSPKKTIEGAIGGAVLTVIIITVIESYVLNVPVSFVFISLIIIILATFGDFVESYMKRKLGIKDSGNLIPGHGGILDRMDSIYLSVLPYLVILSLFR